MEISTAFFLVVLVVTLGVTTYSIIDRVLTHRELMAGKAVLYGVRVDEPIEDVD